MKIAVGIMAHNVVAGLRHDLLVTTIESVRAAFPTGAITVFDNLSFDGTREVVAAYGGKSIWTGNGTPGSGRNAMVRAMWDAGPPDVFVLSDDDMLWQEGAEAKLTELFGALDCPADLALVSGLLEPEYPWNTPRARIAPGGVPVLIRDSCPGCAWAIPRRHLDSSPTHRTARWAAMQRQCLFKDDFGYDHDYCVRLAAEGERVGQLDLATHLGWEASTHGNRADRDIRAKPLDRDKWGI